MPRMIDLVRTSRLPSNLMQFAACGALSVPPSETIEILVHLALHNNLFGRQAGLTLAGWDEKASLVVAADPKTSPAGPSRSRGLRDRRRGRLIDSSLRIRHSNSWPLLSHLLFMKSNFTSPATPVRSYPLPFTPFLCTAVPIQSHPVRCTPVRSVPIASHPLSGRSIF